MSHPGNPNPNTNPNSCSYFADHNIDHHHQHQSPDFEVSDYLIFDDDHHHHGFNEDSYSNKMVTDGSSSGATSENSNTNIKNKNGMKEMKMEVGQRVAFITKSELEVMDDGFKWRKYGKKSVKNSPYPRNYFKCSSGGCQVKKRVERDSEDSSNVITTYEGIHNHESPSVVYDYYNHHDQQQQMPQNAWTLQPSSSPPSSSSS